MRQCLLGVARPHFDEGQVAPGYGIVRVQLNAPARHRTPFIVKTPKPQQQTHPAVGWAGDRIQVDGLPSGSHALFPRHAQVLLVKLRRSNVACVQLGDHRQGQHAARIHRYGSACLTQRLLPQHRVVAADGIVAVGVGTHGQVVRLQVAGAHALRHVLLGRMNLRRNGTHDVLCDLLLHGKHIFQHAVVLLSPDVVARGGINQLGRHAHALVCAAHAALQQVTHAQLAGDRAHVHRAALVGERGVACNHKQRVKARQLGGDVFADAIGKVVLLRVAAQIEKRQHGDGGLVGQGQINLGVVQLLAPSLLTTVAHMHFGGAAEHRCTGQRSAGRGGGGQFLHRQSKLIAPPRHVQHSLNPEQLAQSGHLHTQVVFCHYQTGPNQLQQLVLADDTIAVFNQAQQHVKRTRAHALRDAIQQQLATVSRNFKSLKLIAARQGDSVNLKLQTRPLCLVHWAARTSRIAGTGGKRCQRGRMLGLGFKKVTKLTRGSFCSALNSLAMWSGSTITLA